MHPINHHAALGSLHAEEAPTSGNTAPGAPPIGRWLQRLRQLQRLPTRLLHPHRRSAAIRELSPARAPRTILVVCTGNLYRSPYAAERLRASLPEALRARIQVRSAGFVGADRPCLPDALSVAAERGIDLSSHRSSPLTPSTVDGADLLVVMDPQHARMITQRYPLRARQIVLVLGDLDPQPSASRTIVDPWDAPGGTLERSYDRIERCVESLIEALSE